MVQTIKFETEGSILEVGRVIIAEGVLPHRLVLRELPGEFVIHTEILRIQCDTMACNVITFVHDSFENGTYFNFAECDVHGRFEAVGNARAMFYQRTRAQ